MHSTYRRERETTWIKPLDIYLNIFFVDSVYMIRLVAAALFLLLFVFVALDVLYSCAAAVAGWMWRCINSVISFSVAPPVRSCRLVY